MKRGLASVCACAVLLGAGCAPKAPEQQQGPGASATATSRPPRVAAKAKRDPCSLITTAEMAEVLGVRVPPAKADGDTCDYPSQDPATDGGAQVNVSWDNDNEGPAMLEALRQTGKVEIVPGAEPENLAGLGDGANYSTFALNVLKGDTILTFRITPPPARLMALLKAGTPPLQVTNALSSQVLAKEKLLAAKALARL